MRRAARALAAGARVPPLTTHRECCACVARVETSVRYPPLLIYIFVLCIYREFLSFEPFSIISDVQSNVKNFLVGMSPACVDDTEYPCLDLTEMRAWEHVAIWTNQSVIKPIWGNYGPAERARALWGSLSRALILMVLVRHMELGR